MLTFMLLAALAWQAPPTTGPHPPFEAVALSWVGEAEGVRVRVSDDGVTWSEWTAVTVDEDLAEGDAHAFYSTIVHFGRESRYVETNVPGARVTLFPMPERGPRVRAEGFTLGPVPIRSRSDWGCPDGQGSRWTPAYTAVTHAIVHHTAGVNSVPDWDAELRNIWFFHTVTRGWGDIGYNFLIAPDGTIYEGRAGGGNAIGAHFSCRNTNTVGVAMLGTFTTTRPTDAALASLKTLLAELLRRNALDPNAVAVHAPSRLELPRIASHRDGNAAYPTYTCTVTECPGNALYALLPEIRASIALPPAPPRRRSAR